MGRVSSLESVATSPLLPQSAALTYEEPEIEMTPDKGAWAAYSRDALLSQRVAKAGALAPRLLQWESAAQDDIKEVSKILDSLCASLCQKLYATDVAVFPR